MLHTNSPVQLTQAEIIDITKQRTKDDQKAALIKLKIPFIDRAGHWPLVFRHHVMTWADSKVSNRVLSAIAANEPGALEPDFSSINNG